MGPENTPAVEAVAEAVAEARAEGVELGAAAGEARAEAVAEAAAERVAAAEGAAQAAADALAMTTICQRMDALERAQSENGSWHGLAERMATALETLANAQTMIASALNLLTAMLETETETEPLTPSSSFPSEPGANPPRAEDAGGPAKPKSSGRGRLI